MRAQKHAWEPIVCGSSDWENWSDAANRREATSAPHFAAMSLSDAERAELEQFRRLHSVPSDRRMADSASFTPENFGGAHGQLSEAQQSQTQGFVCSSQDSQPAGTSARPQGLQQSRPSDRQAPKHPSPKSTVPRKRPLPNPIPIIGATQHSELPRCTKQPRKPASLPDMSSSINLVPYATRTGSTSKDITFGTARRGGKTRGSDIGPTRGKTSRPQPHTNSLRSTRPALDTYAVPEDADDFPSDETFSHEANQYDSLNDDNDLKASRVNSPSPPRRSTRRTTTRPGAYTTLEVTEAEEEEVEYAQVAFVPEPTPSLPPVALKEQAAAVSPPKWERNRKKAKLSITQPKRSSRIAAHQATINPPPTKRTGASEAQLLAPQPPPSFPRTFVIGLDYGTTFTSSIRNWPSDGHSGSREQVPTELWYSSDAFVRQESDADADSSVGEADAESGIEKSKKPSRQNNNSWAAVNQRQDQSDRIIGNTPEFLWGYQVPYEVYRSSNLRDTMRRIERPKLMLVETAHTEDDRQRLRPRLAHLIKNGVIRKHSRKATIEKEDVQDVIVDFLTKVLGHTKQQLIQLEGLTEDCPVSFALTVPSIWSESSSRIMQTSIEKAIRATEFGSTGYGSVDNLFIVSEPEAGATFAQEMIAGETFTFMDCGGGTVDVVTYTMTHSYPLRLNTEVGSSTGDNCGASYLNDNFEKQLLAQLSDEDYLDCNGLTRQDIVRHAIPNFEDFQKRTVNILEDPQRDIFIPGLRGDQRSGRFGKDAKKFDDNCLWLDVDDYNIIFLPLLHRVEIFTPVTIFAVTILTKFQKVFLIGGFGAAPSLKSYLKTFLVKFVQERGLAYDMELLVVNEQQSVTGVGSGAALRSLNLEQGPSRHALLNYGFLRWEQHCVAIDGHRTAEYVIDPFDRSHVVKVIHYFMVKGAKLSPVHNFEPLETVHAFSIDEERFLCEEILWVNEGNPQNSFPPEHPMNEGLHSSTLSQTRLTIPFKGAIEAGRIIVDMTFLRDEGKITPIYPEVYGSEEGEYDEEEDIRGKPHYLITYDIVPIVQGRNLRYEVRYPAGEPGKTQKIGQICIAAAFTPGTG
ncbi:uncharacterized protein PAC_14943 [Phialocephala subalpina]|uniref:Hsp70 protein n=1 Tax=Phialocephala subalpina TaxID=576137 RepID=A0A1L7XJ45_9HELO|nr:uncharacterized protein PAC_14943 [Phialocephala subalpina]